MTPAGWGELARMATGSHDFALKIVQRLAGYRQNATARTQDLDDLGMALDAWWNLSRAQHDEHVLVVPKEWDDAKLAAFMEKWPKTGGRITVIQTKEEPTR